MGINVRSTGRHRLKANAASDGADGPGDQPEAGVAQGGERLVEDGAAVGGGLRRGDQVVPDVDRILADEMADVEHREESPPHSEDQADRDQRADEALEYPYSERRVVASGPGGTGALERIDSDIGPWGGIEDGHFGLAAQGVSHRPTSAVIP